VSAPRSSWWRQGDDAARRALIAASLGWMLDAFDVMLYSLLVPAIMKDLAIDKGTAGWVQSGTLLAAAAGGVIFGVVADRWGRTRALMSSVLIYSVFTAACGFAHTLLALAIFRVCLGFGMGGEWASGAALVSETWPDHVRGKALGFMQSSWAVGYALAALANLLVQDVLGFSWRMVFFVGVLPAFYVVWVRRHVEEPAMWRAARARPTRTPLGQALGGRMLRVTVAVTVMNACALFAWWGLNSWVPAYLRATPATGGIGLSNAAMNGFVVAMQVGMWLGYVTFGYVSDAVGRKRTYVVYLLLAAVAVTAYASTRTPWILLLLGPIVAFLGTGHFSGFGAVTAELYPTEIRATAQGLTYNAGRVASAASPFLVGTLAQTRGFESALLTTAAAFVLAAMWWVFIPETKGRAIA
jgi:MFS family permease